MTTSAHLARVEDPTGLTPPMTLHVPENWQAPDELIQPGLLAVFTDGRSLSPAGETNIVLISQQLPEDFDLHTWQVEARARQLASLPDLQVLDDRAIDAGGVERWYRASVMTDASGSTVLTRQWSQLLGNQGVTLTLTTLPTIDAMHAELFDDIAASWVIEVAGGDR